MKKISFEIVKNFFFKNSNLYIQTWKKSIFNRLKKPFLCLTALWFILSDCKDIIVVVVPAGYGESVIIHVSDAEKIPAC